MTSSRVNLFSETGPTSRSIDAFVHDDGRLEISGQDIGEAPRQFFDHDDYEFIMTVAGPAKDALLLALIASAFGGKPSAFDDARVFLAANQIEYSYFTWP